jgi:hypothetical protein
MAASSRVPATVRHLYGHPDSMELVEAFPVAG